MVVGVCGADTKGEGEVEAVVLMRGEVRLDRDAAVFDVSLHDGQYSVHVRAKFLQVLEGHVKEVVGKHVLRSDLESEARSTGVFEQEASNNAIFRCSAWDSGILKCMKKAKTRKRQSPAPSYFTNRIPIESA